MSPSAATDTEWLNFPLGYPFNFGADKISSAQITNNELMDADFVLTFVHEVSEVAVSISGHQYYVNSEIGKDEKFVLNTQKKEVYKQKEQDKTSLFGASSDDAYIYEPIKKGIHIVAWDGDFPIVVTVLEHRRTPIWI